MQSGTGCAGKAGEVLWMQGSRKRAEVEKRVEKVTSIKFILLSHYNSETMDVTFFSFCKDDIHQIHFIVPL
jgi:hypothetical protein